MAQEFNPLLPAGVEIAVGLFVLLTLLGAMLALWREARIGGNVPVWLIAFLIGGPITLLVYGATQFREPTRRV